MSFDRQTRMHVEQEYPIGIEEALADRERRLVARPRGDQTAYELFVRRPETLISKVKHRSLGQIGHGSAESTKDLVDVEGLLDLNNLGHIRSPTHFPLLAGFQVALVNPAAGFVPRIQIAQEVVSVSTSTLAESSATMPTPHRSLPRPRRMPRSWGRQSWQSGHLQRSAVPRWRRGPTGRSDRGSSTR
jgi:hypothetical protein